MREPVADFNSTLTVLFVADLKWEKLVSLIPVGIGYDQSFDRQFFWVLSACKWSFGDGFPCIFRQHWLGVKALHMADPTVHKQPDHILCLGRKMGKAIRRCPRHIVGPGLVLKHRAQSQPRETHAHVCQKCASGHVATQVPVVHAGIICFTRVLHFFIFDYRKVTKSL